MINTEKILNIWNKTIDLIFRPKTYIFDPKTPYSEYTGYTEYSKHVLFRIYSVYTEYCV